MARALKLVTGHEPAMLWHADTALPAGTDLVVLPGGFSYGDYLRCGGIAAHAPIMQAVRAHAGKGGLVLAVCNGFQIACEAGLLPGVLMRNVQLRFLCRDVHLRIERSDSPFTRCFATARRTAPSMPPGITTARPTQLPASSTRAATCSASCRIRKITSRPAWARPTAAVSSQVSQVTWRTTDNLPDAVDPSCRDVNQPASRFGSSASARHSSSYSIEISWPV